MTDILHIITGLGAGGAETMLSQLAVALEKKGLKQHVVSLSGGGIHADRLQQEGIAVTCLRLNNLVSAPGGMAKLAWLVRRERPTVIQGWMYHGNVVAALVYRLARKGTRLMWNIRASNMDEARYGHIIRWNARLSGQPDVVITNSHASIDFHHEHGLRPRRIMVIHNGVDIDKYHPEPGERDVMRKEFGIDPDAIVATVVARVDPMKDHDSFLAALSDLPQVTGLLVGAGTETLRLPGNVIALGLRDDVERVHRAGDMIVSSSAYGEGFSNALVEGMSSGLVPIATDVGDSRLIVGETGRVVPPGSPELLAAAIEAEASLGSDALKKRGLAARQRIVDNYTLEQVVDIYARVYQNAPTNEHP